MMSLEANVSLVPAATNVRKPRGGRSYPFVNLFESYTKPSYTKLTHIHDVVCYNIWVDLIGFHISNATENQFHRSPRYPSFALRMKASLWEELLKIFEDLDDAIYDLKKAEDRIMIFVQTMTFEDSVAYLKTCDSGRFYRYMMINQISFVKDLRMIANGLDVSGELERLCNITYMMGSLGLSRWSSENFKFAYSQFTTLNENRLIFLLDILRKLRESIAVAASARHIPHDLLATLGLRLREFDKDDLYSIACSTMSWASPHESQFVTDSETWWAPTSDTNHDTALPDKNVAYAYASSKSVQSALGFIVPSVMLLSLIPAAMAWARSDAATGTTDDSDFWQAVSNSVLQLLSLAMFIWPAMKDPRLSKAKWAWIRVLAAFSAICTVANVPVYLVASTNWSFAISFVGMLAQSIVQLQVVGTA